MTNIRYCDSLRNSWNRISGKSTLGSWILSFNFIIFFYRQYCLCTLWQQSSAKPFGRSLYGSRCGRQKNSFQEYLNSPLLRKMDPVGNNRKLSLQKWPGLYFRLVVFCSTTFLLIHFLKIPVQYLNGNFLYQFTVWWKKLLAPERK